MVAFAGFHILLSCKGMTTIEFLTRQETIEIEDRDRSRDIET